MSVQKRVLLALLFFKTKLRTLPLFRNIMNEDMSRNDICIYHHIYVYQRIMYASSIPQKEQNTLIILSILSYYYFLIISCILKGWIKHVHESHGFYTLYSHTTLIISITYADFKMQIQQWVYIRIMQRGLKIPKHIMIRSHNKFERRLTFIYKI